MLGERAATCPHDHCWRSGKNATPIHKGIWVASVPRSVPRWASTREPGNDRAAHGLQPPERSQLRRCAFFWQCRFPRCLDRRPRRSHQPTRTLGQPFAPIPRSLSRGQRRVPDGGQLGLQRECARVPGGAGHVVAVHDGHGVGRLHQLGPGTLRVVLRRLRILQVHVAPPCPHGHLLRDHLRNTTKLSTSSCGSQAAAI